MNPAGGSEFAVSQDLAIAFKPGDRARHHLKKKKKRKNKKEKEEEKRWGWVGEKTGHRTYVTGSRKGCGDKVGMLGFRTEHVKHVNWTQGGRGETGW